MSQNGHLDWMVNYQPGVLTARGYNDNKVILEDSIESTGSPALSK